MAACPGETRVESRLQRWDSDVVQIAGAMPQAGNGNRAVGAKDNRRAVDATRTGRGIPAD